MIFVSVGTHGQQFDRLLIEIDRLIKTGKIKENVLAQTGHSSYTPKNFAFKKFMEMEEFDSSVKKCTLFITHAGEGNIGTGLQYEKKMIVVPRLKKFGEHTNDHQLELADAIKKNKQAIITDVSGVERALIDVKRISTHKTEHGKGIMKIIDNFLSETYE